MSNASFKVVKKLDNNKVVVMRYNPQRPNAKPGYYLIPENKVDEFAYKYNSTSKKIGIPAGLLILAGVIAGPIGGYKLAGKVNANKFAKGALQVLSAVVGFIGGFGLSLTGAGILGSFAEKHILKKVNGQKYVFVENSLSNNKDKINDKKHADKPSEKAEANLEAETESKAVIKKNKDTKLKEEKLEELLDEK